MFNRDKPWFHSCDGLYFQRQGDGSVTIAKFTTNPPETLEAEVTLDPDSWGSVVAFVGAKGETSETFNHARAFHDGRVEFAGPPPVKK